MVDEAEEWLDMPMAVKSRGFSSLARLGVVVAVAVLATVGVAVAAPSPAFAAGCSGTSCNGKDPSAMQCDTTAAGVGTVDGDWAGPHVSWELRGSSACSARWVRLTVTYGLIMCCNTAYEFKIERQLWTPYGYYTTHNYNKIYYGGGEGRYWTPMVQNTSDDRHRQCRRTWYWDGYNISNPTSWSCRAWFY